jgi:pyruvate kinase
MEVGMVMLNIKKKTKIVCTLGPASDTYERFSQLVDAGMNVMRLNFAHGDYPSHAAKIALSRRYENEHGIFVPVMTDMKGPEIRTGNFENGQAEIIRGSIVRVMMKDILGNANVFSVNYSHLFEDVNIGDQLKIDDGNLELTIVEKDFMNRELVVRAENTHIIKSHKGVNAPFARLQMPYISPKDEADLRFSCEQDVDLIATSFTRRAQDVMDVRAILTKYGKPDIGIIAKIENPEGVEHIDEILNLADGIMIARGDLGVEIPPEKVPLVQKEITHKCRVKGKPVITATQMLDSMQTNPRPTRAEVSDVANAILESADAVMLSAESASGEYPIEATEMQAKIAATMEDVLDYEQMAHDAYETSEKINSDAIANSVANTALLIGAKLIVCFTETGESARRISKARPCAPVLAVSNNRPTVMRLGLVWGLQSTLIPIIPQFIEDMEVLALFKARQLGLKPGEHIILTGGTPTGAGKTNFMKILMINQLRDI